MGLFSSPRKRGSTLKSRLAKAERKLKKKQEKAAMKKRLESVQAQLKK